MPPTTAAVTALAPSNAATGPALARATSDNVDAPSRRNTRMPRYTAEATAATERPPEIPLTVVINPLVTPQAREMSYDWEGCLSIPDLRGLVPRHPKVRVQGLDREGKRLDYIATGFEARIVQHEYDHLNGVVFLDRMRDFKSLSFFEEWETYLVGRSQQDLDDTAVG